jgi:hypothetical protein
MRDSNSGRLHLAVDHEIHSPTDEALGAIRDFLRDVRFGSVALTIHDGRIVQLDLTEKRRLTT